MDENTIQRLLKEAAELVDMQENFRICNEKVENISMKMAILSGEIPDDKIFDTIASNYAYSGFLEGIEFTLRNLDIQDG